MNPIASHLWRSVAIWIGIVMLAGAGSLLIACGPQTVELARTPLPSAVATSVISPTPSGAATAAPSLSPQPAPTILPPTASPTAVLPVAGATRTFGTGTMVFVPAGDFLMGTDGTTDSESPRHTVTLAAFWIDRTEITNAQYGRCVAHGACSAPGVRGSSSRANYYGDSQFDPFPVIGVTWSDAERFCRWDGKRLPSEAEWEKAARGMDGRVYPWGSQYDKARLNAREGGAPDTVPVGSYPAGASPYGALDMAGNVWEWVQDWYDAAYYLGAPRLNPTGPASGSFRVLRGGAWISDASSVTTTNRGSAVPDRAYGTYGGFRCARGE